MRGKAGSRTAVGRAAGREITSRTLRAKLPSSTRKSKPENNRARNANERTHIVEPVSFEELLVSTGGYGIARIQVREGCPSADRALADSGLRRHDITVLVVRRGADTFPNPTADLRILVGDELLCFGKLDHIRELFATCEEGTPEGANPGNA